MGDRHYLHGASVEIYGGIGEFMSVDITEHIKLHAMTDRVMKVVTTAVKTGVLNSYNGKAAFIYKRIGDYTNLPTMNYKTGDNLMVNRWDVDIMDELGAMHKLQGGTVGHAEQSWQTMDCLYKCEIPIDIVRKTIVKPYVDNHEEKIQRALGYITDGAVLDFNHTMHGD